MPVTPMTLMRAVQRIGSPAHRYRNARTLHVIRVTAAMLSSILLTSGINIPHGAWASVSMLVVIGGLQHAGNIRQKAYERAVGTGLGAAFGLAYVTQHALIGSPAMTYALLSITAGVCGYHAIGKGGYIALLTAMTMSIVAGHGDHSIDVGLWRTTNVVIGIGIALAFSFAIPLHASYSWRHGTASNLRACARLMRQMLAAPPLTADAQIVLLSEMSGRLVALRAMMASVSKESNLPLRQLEDIQRSHLALLTGVEMIASTPLALTEEDVPVEIRQAFQVQCHAIRKSLVVAARALRSRSAWSPDPAHGVPHFPRIASADLSVELHGPYWLLSQIAGQCRVFNQCLGKVDLASLR